MNSSPHCLSLVLAAVATVFASTSASLPAATPVPLVTGLTAPTKTSFTIARSLLVAEAGTGPNTGRISIVNPADGSRRTLIQGLPSGLAAPNNQPSGPSGLYRHLRTVYFTISTGDAVVTGSTPGTTVANPRPASPLFTSVLSLEFTLQPELIVDPLVLLPEDHATLKSGRRVTRNNITLELVADFPDYVADPSANAPDNVRASNPFGLTVLGERLYVVDASLNSIHAIDLATRAVSTLTTFAPLPNTRGMGPPVVEAVPDSIRAFGDKLLVSFLTGFPFPLGGAQVRLVDPATGANTPFITGLNSAIDAVALPGGGFLTLEHTSDMLAGAAAGPSGRLQWFATPDAKPVVIAEALRNPTHVQFDERTAEIYITEIFAGRILKVSPWNVGAGQFSTFSVRGTAGTGNGTLIAGFVIEGAMKQVLVRGVGPRLEGFGVSGALADPRIALFDSTGRLLAENDNWTAVSNSDTELITAAAAKAGTFPLAPGSRDSAVLRVLAPGAYTVHVSGVGGATGVALLEVYAGR
jgi:hypothetical protein